MEMCRYYDNTCMFAVMTCGFHEVCPLSRDKSFFNELTSKVKTEMFIVKGVLGSFAVSTRTMAVHGVPFVQME